MTMPELKSAVTAAIGAEPAVDPSPMGPGGAGPRAVVAWRRFAGIYAQHAAVVRPIWGLWR